MEPWMERLMDVMDETSKEDMRCAICQEMTRERGIAFTPGKPTRPIIFAACPLCKLLPGWEEEVDRIISGVINDDTK